MTKKKIAVLTGAGVSAESGIKTFRDAGGLASPQGWQKNKELVLDFYNQRRAQLLEVEPNEAHKALVELEEKYDVAIVTQNVDDLHERAGSTNIIHLHGELTKVRSTGKPKNILEWKKDCNLGDLCADGHQLRPHIVWFGEQVPMLEKGAIEVQNSDIIIIIGTSMQVYPAAGLVGYAQPKVPIIYIDPKPALNYELQQSGSLVTIPDVATKGVRKVVDELMK